MNKHASLLTTFKLHNNLRRLQLRLAAIICGFASGIYGGLIVGALLGSLIPGFGSVAGAVLGCILGGIITAGIGTAGAKYGMRSLSCLFHVNDQAIINPTNPDKYRLSKTQTRHLAENGVTDTQRVFNMMKSVKMRKPNRSFWPDKKAVKINAEYDDLLSAVKTNPVVNEKGMYLGKNSLFYWREGRWAHKELQRQPAYSPQYRRA